MYTLNIYPNVYPLIKMSVNEIRDVIFENYYKRIGFSKENSYHSMKCLTKKIFIVVCKQINRKNT